jgi:hypothetical protein
MQTRSLESLFSLLMNALQCNLEIVELQVEMGHFLFGFSLSRPCHSGLRPSDP